MQEVSSSEYQAFLDAVKIEEFNFLNIVKEEDFQADTEESIASLRALFGKYKFNFVETTTQLKFFEGLKTVLDSGELDKEAINDMETMLETVEMSVTELKQSNKVKRETVEQLAESLGSEYEEFLKNQQEMATVLAEWKNVSDVPDAIPFAQLCERVQEAEALIASQSVQMQQISEEVEELSKMESETSQQLLVSTEKLAELNKGSDAGEEAHPALAHLQTIETFYAQMQKDNQQAGISNVKFPSPATCVIALQEGVLVEIHHGRTALGQWVMQSYNLQHSLLSNISLLPSVEAAFTQQNLPLFIAEIRASLH